MNLKIEKSIRDNKKLRESFIELAIKTFDLPFETWYQSGYWTDKYIPYTMVDGEKVVANASVNIIDTVWNGLHKRYIQIGTVMTDIAYRNKGLSRYLIDEILNDWQDRCDAIYLFANGTVLDFYPKFGFIKETEYQCTMPITAKTGTVKKLDMSSYEDRTFFKKYYAKSNPFSALPMLDNYGLLMFYCSSFMKDCVFYCEEFDAVVVGMQNNDNLMCFDIYCDDNKSISDILAVVSSKETSTVIFGFTPKDTLDCTVNATSGEDDTLFVLKSKDNIFAYIRTEQSYVTKFIPRVMGNPKAATS